MFFSLIGEEVGVVVAVPLGDIIAFGPFSLIVSIFEVVAKHTWAGLGEVEVAADARLGAVAEVEEVAVWAEGFELLSR